MILRIESGISGRMMGHSSLIWIEELATRLDLKGAVFSKHDGGIKVMAEGEEENLKEFVDKLKNGRIYDTIENFYVDWIEPKKPLGNFYILDN